MKRSKQTNSVTPSLPRVPRKINSVRQLRELQRVMAGTLFRPLTPQWRMQKRWTDGAAMADVASEFIKPNDRLSSFERLEIYNRQYWFRVLDCLYDDYPGLRAVVGERKFLKLARAYLARIRRIPTRFATSGIVSNSFCARSRIGVLLIMNWRWIWCALSGLRLLPLMARAKRLSRTTTFWIRRQVN